MDHTLINLPINSLPITDADEEIFLLYSALSQTKTTLVGPDGYHGLGHIDSRKDVLMIQFELVPPAPVPSTTKPVTRTKQTRKKKSDRSIPTIMVEIAQDPSALRSRIGDTGSVVWRASTELARALLQQHFFPPGSELTMFDRDRLAESHCLELGAGTGLVGLVLAQMVHAYTLTDARPLLPLIHKNVLLNCHDSSLLSKITIEELDWLVLSSLPQGTARRRSYFPVPKVTETDGQRAWDLVLAVDCIYNPSLLPAFVDTIDTVSTAGKTWVLVVAELRQEDVLREFMDLWLSQRWQVTRVQNLLDEHFVVWVGQKKII